MALTTESVKVNDRLIATAKSRWVRSVVREGDDYHGRAEHYRGGQVIDTVTCVHKHESDKAATACAEKLPKG